MNKFLKIVFFLFFGIISIPANAQNSVSYKNLEAIIESIIENLDEETDVTLIIEDLEELAETPLNINSTTESELSRLHILNDIQIQNLLNYINQFGPAYSIFELNTIDGFNPELLIKIEPFIQFGEVKQKPEKFSDAIKYGRQQFLARGLGTVQNPEGYKRRDDGSVPFEGNRFRYYTRYRFESRDKLSVGITAEKDPGEAFFSGSNKNGFDFYSAHLSVKINPVIENVTLGDFIVRSGQGLVLWQGYSMGKSVYALDIGKTNQGVRPYTSVDENLHFRGASTTLKYRNAKLSLFYSSNKVDGNIADANTSDPEFTRLQTSGYHRTKSEIADENSISDVNIGMVGNWRFNHLKIGATFLHQKFNLPFVRTDQLYNQFRFTGKENYTGSVDYLFSKGKYQLFGEAAMSKSKGKAVLQGAIANLNDQISFSLLFRHFDKNYHALWANTFSEGSSANNESGLYFGTKILPLKFVALSAYSDIYQSKWLNVTTAAPSKGWDVFTQADFVFSERLEFYIRYKNEEKEQKFTQNERYVNLPERTQKIRLHLQIKPSNIFTIKTRFEHSFYNGIESENGFMIFQDVQITPAKIPLNLSARVAYFNTESYNSRIYAYENDMLYTFSIPAFYGKGFRTYINFKYKITNHLDCWIKLANTSWSDRESISSGYNKIIGNNKTELKFQLRLKI